MSRFLVRIPLNWPAKFEVFLHYHQLESFIKIVSRFFPPQFYIENMPVQFCMSIFDGKSESKKRMAIYLKIICGHNTRFKKNVFWLPWVTGESETQVGVLSCLLVHYISRGVGSV
jgi:hypothetical protein